jgi:hypothetical protein
MRTIDIFNGDADGLCALQQLHRATPYESELVTGVKRDIALLDRVEARAGDSITVLDISLDTNRAGLMRVLEAGARVRWFDHHFAGEIPRHAALEAHIDISPEVCTSALIDRHLGGRFRRWATAAAFGDNLPALGRTLAAQCGCTAEQATALEQLGELLNYNGYGESLDDLHFHPADLFRALSGFDDPLEFVARSEAFARLRDGHAEDLSHAGAVLPWREGPGTLVLVLPDAGWSRRMTGPLANRWAQGNPDRALAVCTPRSDGCYTVSIRAPMSRPTGAVRLAREFGGGGREAAAGINALPPSELDRFAQRLEASFARTE